jgi:hypothetical protein
MTPPSGVMLANVEKFLPRRIPGDGRLEWHLHDGTNRVEYEGGGDPITSGKKGTLYYWKDRTESRKRNG